jgi:hypothetical protein
MKKSILIFCVISTMCLSCKQILLKQYGVTQPRLENYASLNAFLEKNGVVGMSIYALKDTATLNDQYRKKLVGMPEAYFYNKEGNFVPYKETAKSCNAGVSLFLDSIGGFNKLPFDATKNIRALLPNIVELDKGNTVKTVSTLPKSDIYVVMNWAKYIGKVNKAKTWDWLDIINKNREKNPLKITVILLSFDYQESWGITKKDIPKFNF